MGWQVSLPSTPSRLPPERTERTLMILLIILRMIIHITPVIVIVTIIKLSSASWDVPSAHGAQCRHTVPPSSLSAGSHDLARTRSRRRKANKKALEAGRWRRRRREPPGGRNTTTNTNTTISHASDYNSATK